MLRLITYLMMIIVQNCLASVSHGYFSNHSLTSTIDARKRRLDEEAVIKTDSAYHFYPEAKAIRRVYSCCIYSDTNDNGLYCDVLDDECNEDYRRVMNMYYIAGLTLIIFTIAFFSIVLIHAKLTHKPETKMGIESKS